MSSCFNGDWHARQLRWTVVALAMLACGATQAQSVDSEPFTESVVSDRTTLGGTPLRIWHRTEGYGQEASETAFGGRAAMELGGAVGFTDGQFRISNESRFGANVGGGVRWFGDDFLVGAPRIFGVSGWYDGQETVLNNYFNQGGVSFESLGEYMDFRLNANIPFEDQKSGDEVFVTGDLNFSGFNLAQATIVPTDVALRVVDFEVAPRVLDLNLWAYGGGYQMDGDGVSEMGAKLGFRGYLTNDLAVDVGMTDDEVFHTNTVFQIIWTPGRTGAGPTSWIHTLADRMREPVYRNTYIATDQQLIEGSATLTDVAGDDIRIVHVDSNAAPGGDGSFESPFDALTDLDPDNTTLQGDIILVHAESTFNNQTANIIDEQRFLGEGDGNTHTVVTSQLGTVTIPETRSGALNLARPTITNPNTAESVLLATSGDDSTTFSPIEVSNFDFFGGNSAIDTTTGVGAVNINRLAIDGAGNAADPEDDGHAINLTPRTETLANSTTRSRFAPTIDDVTFTDSVGDDIHLDAGTTETTISHLTTISDITSTDGSGIGINLIENQRAATITNFDWNGGSTGLGALNILEAAAQGAVTLNTTNGGTNDITGGAATAFAISLDNSAGTHTVLGTVITNMGGDAIVVDDGAANMNFTGRIEQTANNASILSVTNTHTGSLTFTERVADQGVILATAGDGLQFDNADGVYTFNDEVEISGAGASTATSAVNVINGSDATLTFLNANFLDTEGTTIHFDGGDASMTLTGRVEQNNAFTTLLVEGGHDGTLTFNEFTTGDGVIEANNGDGLDFDDADGAYIFNDAVVLNSTAVGTNVHIDISGASEGTFTFAEGDIDKSTAGAAVIINGSSAIFTYSGDIDTSASDAVELTANTGGSITFNSTIDSTSDGILIQGNTGGAFAFTGQVTLTGTGNGVEILNNTGGSTSFNNIDITKTGAGTGFVATSGAAGHTVTVTGNDNNISTATGVALNLNTIAAGGSGINFESVSSNGAASGIIIDNVTGGPVNIGVGGAAGSGGTIQNSTGVGVGIDAAVMVSNSTNVNLNGLIISGTAATDDGIQVTHSGAVASTVTITNTTISGGLEGIDYNRTASGTSRITLTGNTVSGTAGDAVNMDIGGSGTANITFNNNTLDGGANQAMDFNTSGGAAKTVNLLVDNNTMSNNSAAEATADFEAAGSGTLNSTVTNNVFTNAGTARAFIMASNNPATTVRLNLNANSGVNAGLTDEYLLNNIAGTFQVQDVATVDARNNGVVQQMGTITNDAGPIPTP